jgi:hypothetical protein
VHGPVSVRTIRCVTSPTQLKVFCVHSKTVTAFLFSLPPPPPGCCGTPRDADLSVLPLYPAEMEGMGQPGAYTFPSVLHFLHREHNKFEREKKWWVAEKAELLVSRWCLHCTALTGGGSVSLYTPRKFAPGLPAAIVTCHESCRMSEVVSIFHCFPPPSPPLPFSLSHIVPDLPSSVSFQTRLSFLEGQRLGEANLKRDLLRRIKVPTTLPPHAPCCV